MDGLGSGGPPERVPSTPPIDLAYDDLTDGELIGQGGNADVYHVAVERGGERVPVALKQPRFQGTMHAEQVERFVEEARLWGQLDDHDHVVGLLDWGDEPIPWLAMEYMDGGSLEDLLADGRLPYDQALWVARCVCSAVRHAHRHGVAHHDIKPANVLFREPASGWLVPKVSDWGLARFMLEASGSVEGLSPQYAAPEQFAPDDHGSPDDYTDVYQVGVLTYELLTGRPPFEGPAPAVMNGVLNETPDPPSAVADLPPAVDDAVGPALATAKADRYESIIYLRDALDDLLADAREHGPPSGADPAQSDSEPDEPDEAEPDASATGDPGVPPAETLRSPGERARTGDDDPTAADGADDKPGETGDTAGALTEELQEMADEYGQDPAPSPGPGGGSDRRSLLKVGGGLVGVGVLGLGALALGGGGGDQGSGGNGVLGTPTETAAIPTDAVPAEKVVEHRVPETAAPGSATDARARLEQLYEDPAWTSWTLHGETDLADADWTVTLYDVTGSTMDERAYAGGSFDQPVASADGIGAVEIALDGTAPSESEDAWFLLMDLTQYHDDGSRHPLGFWFTRLDR